MKKGFIKIAAFMLTFILGLSAPAYADKKNEAKKKIDQLNDQIKKAGEKEDLQTALTAGEEAVKVAAEQIGGDSLETAKALNNVANLYMFAEHPVVAERLYKDAILIESKHHDPESLELADSYYNLALAYAVQNKFSEALKMMNRTYKIRAEKLGAEHADTQKARQLLSEINESFGKN